MKCVAHPIATTFTQSCDVAPLVAPKAARGALARSSRLIAPAFVVTDFHQSPIIHIANALLGEQCAEGLFLTVGTLTSNVVAIANVGSVLFCLLANDVISVSSSF